MIGICRPSLLIAKPSLFLVLQGASKISLSTRYYKQTAPFPCVLFEYTLLRQNRFLLSLISLIITIDHGKNIPDAEAEFAMLI